ncbi:hypothetical protein AAA583_23105 [Pseudomonas aeruginosa]
MSSTQHQLIKQCATRLRGIVEALDNIHDSTPHRWSTDLDDVHSSAESLLALIKDQAPAPDARGLAQPSPAQAEQATADDYEEVLADHRRLVRELDVLLNGEEGAAKQASLCDLVGQVSAIVRERRVPLLSPSQAEAERLREAYEWGYGDGQNNPNGYSDKKERDACVNELLKQPSPAQAEGAPVIGCLCGMPMTERHHSQDGCSSLEEFAQHSAQAQAEQGEAAGCQGTNCGTTTGDHSPECLAEAAASQGWELKPEDLGEVDVVAYLATAEHPKHGQPHKAINYSKYSHDAQVAHWRARGCTVTEDQLMTVSQHASSVALWADLFNRVQRERDAALARVAELETALEPFAAVADAYDDSEDDDHEPYTDMGCDDRLRLTLGQHRAGRIALEGRTPQAQAQHSVPDVCDSKEQNAFEEWASKEGMNMECHPLHWLFLDAKTYSARQGWKAALKYARNMLAAAPVCRLSRSALTEAQMRRLYENSTETENERLGFEAFARLIRRAEAVHQIAAAPAQGGE